MHDALFRPGTLDPRWGALTPPSESEQRWLSFASAADALLFELLTDDDRLSWIGDSVERITGWRAHELTADDAPWTRLLHPDDRETALRTLRASGGRGRCAFECRMRHGDGSTHWYRVVGIGVSIGGRAAVRVVATDVSELHRLRTQLAAQAQLAAARGRLHAEARAASEAKSAFLSALSHELRTPLSALDGFLALLELDVGGALTARQRDFVDRARRAGAHVLHIVEDLLDLSRIEQGRLSVERAVFDAGLPARQAVEIVRPQCPEAEVALRYTEPSGPIGVLADANRVRQILINLLGNALKFTARGEVAMTVEHDERMVRYVVRDTGRGIAADELERIFEPFYQADPMPGQTHAGAGLGLAVSHSLARAMCGDLTVTSAQGAGSTFTLVLPRAPA